MYKLRIIRTSPLMEVEPIESEPEKKARIERNRHKTPRQKKDYPSDDPRHLSRNEKLDLLFAGHGELRKLAKGIYEEKPVSKKTGRREQCLPGNPNFDSKGRFSTGKDSGGSWSTGQTSSYAAAKEKKTSCDRGQQRRSGKVRKFTKVPCGRASRKKGKRTWTRCRDGKEVFREESLKLPETEIENMKQVDIDNLISLLRKKQDSIDKLRNQVELVKKTKCKNGNVMTVSDLARAINAVERAQKGKLNTPDDKGK